MIIRLKSIIFLLAALAGTGLLCTHDGPVAGIEVTNGDCTGTIYRQDSTVAAGAVVRLIPADYDPLDTSTGLVDSTTADMAGRYAFNVVKADLYNVIAEKDGASSISEAVSLQPEASVVVNDTLGIPGKLTGRVSVKSEDDARQVVILIRGMNIYTMPIDSAGTFATPPLPAGTFTVQMLFTGNDEYARFDTVIAIISGETANLQVTLPSDNAPPVTGLSVQYDSATMYATLSWEQADTSKVVSYVLHRTGPAGNDTTVTVDKSVSSYVDDVVFHENDTLSYTIAAIGKNFREGYRSDPVALIPGSLVECVKKVRLQYGLSTGHVNPSLFVDRDENYFFADKGTISKMDSNGVLVNRFIDTSIYDEWGPLQADGNGNIYRLKSGSYRFTAPWNIVKFGPNLTISAELPVSDTTLPIGNSARMTVMGNGWIALLVEYDSGSDYRLLSKAPVSRHLLIYDTDFRKIGDYPGRGSYPTERMYCFDNQIILKHSEIYTTTSGGIPQNELEYLDSTLTPIMTFSNIAGIDRFIPSPLKLYVNTNEGFGSPDAGPGGLIFAYAWMTNRICPDATCPDLSPLVFICNRESRLLARRTLPETSTSSFASVHFNNADFFYTMNVSYPEVTVYKYSLRRINSRNGK